MGPGCLGCPVISTQPFIDYRHTPVILFGTRNIHKKLRSRPLHPGERKLVAQSRLSGLSLLSHDLCTGPPLFSASVQPQTCPPQPWWECCRQPSTGQSLKLDNSEPRAAQTCMSKSSQLHPEWHWGAQASGIPLADLPSKQKHQSFCLDIWSGRSSLSQAACLFIGCHMSFLSHGACLCLASGSAQNICPLPLP